MLLNSPAKILVSLPRRVKKVVVLLLDVALCYLATWAAFCLRFDSIVTPSETVVWVGSVSVLCALPLLVAYGLYRAIFRFSGWFATVALTKALFLYAVVYTTIYSGFGVDGVPRSIGILQPLLLFVAIGGTRLLANFVFTRYVEKMRPTDARGIALIYGAGSAGRQIAAGLQQTSDIKPMAFVDDDERLWNGLVNGLPVYPPGDVERLIESGHGITDVLLAIPSASKLRQKTILKMLSELPVHVRTLPGLSHLANGIVKIEDIRDVEIDDVLGRETVAPVESLLQQNIIGRAVLVTGAGGSIGSEICRQVLLQKPSVLVLFELSEFALYSIERELVQKNTNINIVPVLGSVLDEKKLVCVMRRFRIQTVYHAAAYKHVPMIEMNPLSGVSNNVFGTLKTVEAACKTRVETFVLVSTDKAVRPTNVMGCTKRLAELILQAKSSEGTHSVKLTMVRFGNVLASSGSVVPVFKEQIKRGGPLTVTHPEIIRYFMTIPEAAQLVIQAGAMGEGGDVMVLDMGEPVKILDLAKRMIHLSGLSHRDDVNPDGDIEIQFTGLRPGEKLYEELLIGENTFDTKHQRIMRAEENSLSWEVLEPLLVEIEASIENYDSDALLRTLKKAVPEFNPQSENGDVLKH